MLKLCLEILKFCTKEGDNENNSLGKLVVVTNYSLSIVKIIVNSIISKLTRRRNSISFNLLTC